jgi:hypothetical protein
MAEAWEAATSYPDFRFAPATGRTPVCVGLSCVLRGSVVGWGEEPVGCRFRCYEAPARGGDEPFPEGAIRVAGPLLAPDLRDHDGIAAAVSGGREAALDLIDASRLRGRGGAYFPVGRKWRAALDQGRPIALVVNAEEGEPGVFKDRARFCRRPYRFLEGLAIAVFVLQPAEIVIFINGRHRRPSGNWHAPWTMFG